MKKNLIPLIDQDNLIQINSILTAFLICSAMTAKLLSVIIPFQGIIMIVNAPIFLILFIMHKAYLRTDYLVLFGILFSFFLVSMFVNSMMFSYILPWI